MHVTSSGLSDVGRQASLHRERRNRGILKKSSPTRAAAIPEGIGTACTMHKYDTSIAARGGGGSFKRLKLYNSEEHLPIESFVTTLIHWTFFLMMRTKLAFVGFVAAGNSMWHQVLDDLCLVVTDQSATTWDSSHAPNSTQYNSVLQSSEKCYPSTILYYKVLLQKVLLQYYSPYYKVLLRTTKY